MKNKTKKVKFDKKKYVYTYADYNSGDGMLTTVWGPGLWHYLHTMSFNYPNEPTKKEKNDYRDFILSLKNVLPCGKCRENLKHNFKSLPLKMRDMKNRYTFSKYVYDLHELINKMLNKESGLSYEEVRERYEHFRARCVVKENKRITKKKKKEDGCVDPLYGEKSKCVLQIVPQEKKCDTIQIDDKCIKKKFKN
jgi:hypothetical protein